MRPGLVWTTICLAALLAFSIPIAAVGATLSTDATPLRVPRVADNVRVDGVLDEHVWQEALVMGVNTEVRPSENVPAPVETEMLLAYSESHFYIAFRAYDPDPSKICAHMCDRDRMWDDEWVVIGIDTYNDQRGGYEFACNPFGIQGDTANGIHGDGNSWDAIWDSAGRITDWGYAVEMAIPFSSFRFQHAEGDQIWGVDAVRSYPRDVRHHIGLYARDRDNNCYFCQMEKLIGFAGATPGRNIELDPTFSTFASQQREDYTKGSFQDPDAEYDLGLTARWGVTPNVTLAAAANPDFSQVEADAFQLDVNRRYALSYEEKRPFFLEGSGMFDQFYSRSIADPIWGAKLTGKAGGNGYGALVARDEITNLIFPGSEESRSTSLAKESTAAALRYSRDIGDQSSVEVFFNDREGDDYYNRMGGVSAEIWLTDSEELSIEAYTSGTSYPGDTAEEFGQSSEAFSDQAYVIELGHYTSGLDVYGEYVDIGTDFRTDLGFTPRVGYKEAEAGFGHTWQSGSENWWTMLNFGSSYNRQEDQDGSLRSRGYGFWANYEGQKQSFANLGGWLGDEVYDGDEFETWNVNYEAGFWPAGSLFLMAYGELGRSIDYDNVRTGRQFTITPRVEYKIGRNIATEISHTYERFNVEDGRLYTANVSYLKAVYQVSTRAFVRAILQYVDYDFNTDLYIEDQDPEYQGLASQLLFSYKINPQTVFFFGYSDSHAGDQETDLTQTERTLFAKIGYAWIL